MKKMNHSIMDIGQIFRDTTAAFENLDPSLQFLILVFGVFFFFGIHNYLQEAIMHVDGFQSHGVMLGYFEVLGVTICSYIERHEIVKERGRVAPISAYPLLTLCLMASSGLSNMSLNYINFATKVVFRSCKLIPTMVIASFIHRKVFNVLEYICAAAVCAGLIMFAAAESELSPSFHPIGLVLVSGSVCADAFLPNAQERLFKLGSSRLEVTLYTNIFVLALMTIIFSVDLIASIKLISTSPQLQIYFTIYTFIAYIAISFHMNVVKKYGAVVAVLVASGRKAMTLILSFLLFPKPFSWFYPFGALLVLGGLTVSSLAKIYNNNVNGSNGSVKERPEEHLPLKAHASDLDVTTFQKSTEMPAATRNNSNNHTSTAQ